METRRPVCGVGGSWGLLLYICCLAAAAGADGAADGAGGGEEAYTEESYPNPMKEFQACGVKDVSYVCDPSHQLSEYEIQQLNQQIESLRNVETCLCDDSSDCRRASRHTIMVALVPRIKYSTGGFPSTDDAERTAARRFAEHMRDTSWWIMDVSCSLQAYIVYDIHTRRLWTATNRYGRKVITDERAGEVARSVKGDYMQYDMTYRGIEDMISKYKQFLEDGPPGLKWWEILLIVLGSLTGFGLLVCLCCCCCRGGCKGGGGGGGGVWGGGWGGGGGGCGGGCGGGGGGGGGGCGGGGGD